MIINIIPYRIRLLIFLIVVIFSITIKLNIISLLIILLFSTFSGGVIGEPQEWKDNGAKFSF